MNVSPARQTPASQHGGTLCSTCLDGPLCGLRYGQISPVLYCEEFSLPEISKPARSWPRRNTGLDGVDPPAVVGLCKTCANYHRCYFKKPDGGVWHCEEYV